MAAPLLAAAMTEKNMDRAGDFLAGATKVGFALAALGGSFLVVRSIYNNVKGDVISKQALQQGTPAWYADEIGAKLNLNNWYGVIMNDDEEGLYKLLDSVPPKQMQDVLRAFRATYNKNLLTVFQAKLSASEYQTAKGIIEKKLA